MSSVNAVLMQMYKDNAHEELLRKMCALPEEQTIPLKVNPKIAWELLEDEKYKGLDAKLLIDMANTQIGGKAYAENNNKKMVLDRATAIAVLRGAY